jgi:starch-binding outer membrane protein, SusD/RagB family
LDFNKKNISLIRKKNFMKINTNAKLIVILVLLLTSCTKILDLQPSQNIPNDVALSSDAAVEQVLVGAYDNFSSVSLYGGDVMRNSELYGGEGEVNWVGTFEGPLEIFNRQILTVNDDVTAFWEQAYNCINNCNNVIASIAVVNPHQQRRVEGEAKFLRAYIYFDLTRFFGQQYDSGAVNSQPGVPLILQPTKTLSDNSSAARNTVEECYTQIISDLTDAKQGLPYENDVFANRYAAEAILARVYLQQSNYSSARKWADSVIEGGAYSLVANYADEFAQDNNTTEDIFAIQISPQDGINDMNTFFSTPAYGGRGDIQIEKSFVDSYDKNDTRKSLYYKYGGNYFTAKYNNEFGNLSIIRLAEMYLIRAECNKRLNGSFGARPLEDYNLIHKRAGLPAATTVTLDDILLERQFELAHEGFKIFDIKRLHGTVGTMEYNDPSLVFPIPSREIEVNPNLVQNPGY